MPAVLNRSLHKPSAVLFLCAAANFLLFLLRYYASIPPPKWLFLATGMQLPAVFIGATLFLIYKLLRQRKRPSFLLYTVVPMALANYWLFSVIVDHAVRAK